ncbi:MAG TPA: CvpA family protein [Deltaproteobacteria bacterium]|nr:CvpA family protein [Deltaproteobacteria bacterium]
MNALDGISLLVMVMFIGLGIFSGLLKSVSSLVALAAGIFLAKITTPAAIDFLARIRIPMTDISGVVAFIGVFFFFFLGIKIVFYLLHKLSRSTGLTPMDRALGGLMGLVKAVIIVVLIFTVSQAVLPKKARILSESKMLPYSNRVVSVFKGLLPGH